MSATTLTYAAMKVVRIKLSVLGERGYPEAFVTLPEHIVGDLPDLVARARALTPGVSVQSVLYTLWRLGSRRLDQSLHRRIPVRAADVELIPRCATGPASNNSSKL